jgi:hypothetical protein
LLLATAVSAKVEIAGIDFVGLASSDGVVPRQCKITQHPELA